MMLFKLSLILVVVLTGWLIALVWFIAQLDLLFRQFVAYVRRSI